jgi:hypothetical protein
MIKQCRHSNKEKGEILNRDLAQVKIVLEGQTSVPKSRIGTY